MKLNSVDEAKEEMKKCISETEYYFAKQDAFEKREQMLQLRARVLQAEQERIDGEPTISVSESVAETCFYGRKTDFFM